jgi:very-short-patch-repair endonuclease
VAAQPNARSADALIGPIARRQQGVVARAQLLTAGVSRHAVATRLADGRLAELHRGVYLVGAVPGPHAHEMAALLAYRLKAALSHRSAANLWGLLSYPATAPAWITVAPEQSATRPGIEARRARLHRRDVRNREGMLVTSPPRTLLDMASLLDPYELEALVAEASYRGLASERELRDQLERNPGRRGTRALREVLDTPGGPRRTRSPAERLMLRLMRARGIEGYEVNERVHGHEVDFLWRGAGLVVEVDGYDAHRGRVAFERDRLKWATLEAKGLSIMPVTGRQIRRDPDGVIDRLLGALRARAGGPTPRPPSIADRPGRP